MQEFYETGLAWFNTLAIEHQVSLVSAAIAAASALFVAGVAALATYIITTSSNKRQARYSADQSLKQLQAVGIQKVAEMRIKWIEDLREATVTLYRLQYELNLIRRRKNAYSDDRAARRRQLWIEISGVKQDILLRMNPNTDSDDEKRLRLLLRRSVVEDRTQARKDRKEITEIANRILNTEWKKLKLEMRVENRDVFWRLMRWIRSKTERGS